MLKKFISTLTEIKNQDALTLGQELNSGHAVVVADKTKSKDILIIRKTQKDIKYLFRVEGNKLYAYKLSDSTDTKLILTLCAVFPMTTDCFKLIYDTYIQGKNYMYMCDDSVLDFADFRAAIPGSPTSVPLDEKTRNLIDAQFGDNKKMVLFLESPYE